MFLFASAVVLWSALGQMLSSIASEGAKKPYVALLYFIAAIMATTPISAVFYEALMQQNGNALSASPGQASVWVSLAGACVIAVLLVAQIRKELKINGGLSFWRMGGYAIVALAVFEVGMATAMQVAFVNDQAGMVNFDAFRSEVQDIECDSSILLARFEKRETGSAVVYRCPTLMILNRNASAPFVPWPNYTEGSSMELGKAIDAIKAEMNTTNESQ